VSPGSALGDQLQERRDKSWVKGTAMASPVHTMALHTLIARMLSCNRVTVGSSCFAPSWATKEVTLECRRLLAAEQLSLALNGILKRRPINQQPDGAVQGRAFSSFQPMVLPDKVQ